MPTELLDKPARGEITLVADGDRLRVHLRAAIGVLDRVEVIRRCIV